MKRVKTTLVLSLMALAMAGCAPKPFDNRPPLQVKYGEMQMDYAFPRGGAILSDGERGRIAQFLTRASLGAGDAIFVTVPTTGVAVIDKQRVAILNTALSRTPGRISLILKNEPMSRADRGILRVLRDFSQADVNCTAGVDAVGCANDKNLAAMLTQSADLVVPAQTGRHATH